MSKQNNNVAKACWVLPNLTHYHVARALACRDKELLNMEMLQLWDSDSDFPQLQANHNEEIFVWTALPGKSERDSTKKDIIRQTWAALNNIAPDIVFASGWSHICALIAILWSEIHKRPVVILSESNAHDWKRIKLKEIFKRNILSGISGGIVGGKNAQEYLKTLIPQGTPIFQGYDVIDNDHFNADKLKPDALEHDLPTVKSPYFIAVARLTEKKNHKKLLEAYSIYRKRIGCCAWPLVFVGAGPLLEDLKQADEENGSEKSVVFVGAQ